ncbi:MAG: hypothetical protein AAF961_12990, partial [Planctomycetota bacterium]
MSLKSRLADAAFASTILLATGLGQVLAQTSDNAAKLQEAETRLRAIYEDREFRANGFRGEWSSDSSSYTIRRRDPNTNEWDAATYDVRTGERVDNETPAAESAARNRRLSPDGAKTLEIRGNKIFARDLASDQR